MSIEPLKPRHSVITFLDRSGFSVKFEFMRGLGKTEARIGFEASVTWATAAADCLAMAQARPLHVPNGRVSSTRRAFCCTSSSLAAWAWLVRTDMDIENALSYRIFRVFSAYFPSAPPKFPKDLVLRLKKKTNFIRIMIIRGQNFITEQNPTYKANDLRFQARQSQLSVIWANPARSD